MFTISGEKNKLEDGCVNIKFLKVWKSNKLKSVPQIYFCINQVVSTISVLTLLQKALLWFYLLCGLDSNAKFSSIWLEDGSNGLHNKSLALSLLEICCSSSPLNVL